MRRAVRCMACVLSFCLAVPAVADTIATYEVVFDASWSASTHPSAYPAGAHFSPLIGATHNSQSTLWEPGGQATVGIEQMAETGGTSVLQNEIQAAIAAGTATGTLLGSGISSPGSTQISFEVQQVHPLVTLVTMVAPSPDWFLGVTGLELRENDQWIDQVVVDLFAYDAGTDSGTDFTSPNDDTNPADAIGLLGPPLAGGPRLGTFTFTNLSVVPEPGSWALAWLTILPVVAALRRRKSVQSPTARSTV